MKWYDPLLLYAAGTRALSPGFSLTETLWTKFCRGHSWNTCKNMLLQRLSLFDITSGEDMPNKPVDLWLHGASVGETRTALSIGSLLYRMSCQTKEKNMVTNSFENILVTSVNIAAQESLFRNIPILRSYLNGLGFSTNIYHQVIPYDCVKYVDRFLSYYRPQQIIFFESELWPVLLTRSKRTGAKLYLLDGHLSLRSRQRWTCNEFGRETLSKVLSSFDFIGARTEEDAAFFACFGGQRVEVIPFLKAVLPLELHVNATSRVDLFYPCWMAVSTHFPEEISILRVHLDLGRQSQFSRKPLLVLAPRHSYRANQIIQLALSIGFKLEEIALYSKGPCQINTLIYIVDSYGTLSSFYNACKVVFVGNSLFSPGGGHNIAEGLHYKCAVLHGISFILFFWNFTQFILGPFITNFLELHQALSSFNVSPVTHVVKNEIELFHYVKHLLQNPQTAEAWGEIGYQCVKRAEELTVSTLLREMAFFTGRDSREDRPNDVWSL
eukprot:jgi/Galph1/5979/GphlegSOOS_G4549.1